MPTIRQTMDNNRLLTLLNKYQDNSCTDLELQELEQWYASLNTGNIPVEASETFTDEMLMQFRNKLITEKPTIPFYRKTFFRVAAAAAIIIMIGIGSYFAFFNNVNNPQQVAGNQPPTDITAPNSSKAYITLSNGKKINLDSLQNGSVAIEGDMAITKQGDQVIYTAAGSSPSGEAGVRFNTLTIDKGSKPFKLLLADGSEMWLDAATTVTYPNAFVGKERKVEIITGQAYFEIAHNASMPFIMKKGDAEVEVLGTHFNVSAFDGEEMKVTLLEGSVKVSTTEQSVTIKPGEQARQTTNNKLQTINSVDIDEVMAWKNGNFQFEGSDINAVMKQLARWYDVEVEVKGNITEHFGGTISREVNVSKVFELLRLTGEVNYKIEGRKIIVTP